MTQLNTDLASFKKKFPAHALVLEILNAEKEGQNRGLTFEELRQACRKTRPSLTKAIVQLKEADLVAESCDLLSITVRGQKFLDPNSYDNAPQWIYTWRWM